MSAFIATRNVHTDADPVYTVGRNSLQFIVWANNCRQFTYQLQLENWFITSLHRFISARSARDVRRLLNILDWNHSEKLFAYIFVLCSVCDYQFEPFERSSLIIYLRTRNLHLKYLRLVRALVLLAPLSSNQPVDDTCSFSFIWFRIYFHSFNGLRRLSIKELAGSAPSPNIRMAPHSQRSDDVRRWKSKRGTKRTPHFTVIIVVLGHSKWLN